MSAGCQNISTVHSADWLQAVKIIIFRPAASIKVSLFSSFFVALANFDQSLLNSVWPALLFLVTLLENTKCKEIFGLAPFRMIKEREPLTFFFLSGGS